MGLRCGLVKSELKHVRKAYDANVPATKVAKAHRVKPVVINKCYKSFAAADEKAQKPDVADNDDL